jgi:hypothetical protein
MLASLRQRNSVPPTHMRCMITKAPGQGDDGLLGATPAGNLHAPGLEPGPCLGAREQHLRGLVEGGAHYRVAAL